MPKINTALFGAVALIPNVASLPVVETLEFLTDQLESYNGTEQNIQLRFKARQTFDYSIPLQPGADIDVFNTAYGAIRKLWAVPVWTDAQYVGNVTGGLTSINCDTIYHDLRADSLAMLYDGCGKYQLLEVTGKTDTEISLSTPTQVFRGAMLIPVRVGHVEADIQKPTNGYNGSVKVKFQVDDTAEFSPTAPEQFLANDIYYDASLLEGNSLNTSFIQRSDVNDYDVGPIEYRTPWLYSKFGRSHRVMSVTKEERKTFKDFVYRRAGKANVFWMPTFQNDFKVLNTGSIVSTLSFKKNSYLDYATNRTHIAFEDLAGNWYPRTISAPVSTGTDTMQVTLSAPLNVNASQLKRTCYLGLNRLNTDRIEITYGTSQTAESSFPILELTP